MIEIIGPLANPAVTTTSGNGKKSVPLQKQLIERLQQAILTGRLPAGSLLPSSRLLAAEMGVSRNTVVIAYEHLAAVGYVVADKKGTRVSPLSSPSARGETRTSSAAPEVAYAARVEQFAATRTHADNTLPLTPGTPALDRFPLAAWRRALERSMERALPFALGYGDPSGEPALRDAIAAHLRMARGVRCEGSQVVITEGAQEALNLCVRLFTNPGDIVWVEDPGYRGAKAAFNLGDLSMLPMPVDPEGIAVPPDAWRAHPPKLIYTSPAHQYPTGAVLSVARRLELIAQARRCGAWLIEDDYDGEFRHTGEPIASMQGLVEDAPVLYVGSFSKTMFPALRIGFVVLPRVIAAHTAVALQEMLRGGHRLEQLALAHFIDSGEFGRHLGRMRRLYRERQQALRDALTMHFAPSQILGGNCGMHLTLRLPPHISDRTLAERALARRLNPRPFVGFCIAAARGDERAGDRLRQHVSRTIGARCPRIGHAGAGDGGRVGYPVDHPARRVTFYVCPRGPCRANRVVYARRIRSARRRRIARRSCPAHRPAAPRDMRRAPAGPLAGSGMKNALLVVIFDDLSDRRRHEGNRTDRLV